MKKNSNLYYKLWTEDIFWLVFYNFQNFKNEKIMLKGMYCGVYDEWGYICKAEKGNIILDCTAFYGYMHYRYISVKNCKQACFIR